MIQNNVYITDLDATLLNNEAKLSQYTEKMIKELMNKNIKFTVASARSVITIQNIFSNLDLKLPVIEFNGAFISDLKTGKHLVINSIDKIIYKNIFNRIMGRKLNCFISTYNGKEDKLYYDKILNDGELWYENSRIQNKDPRLKKVKDIKEINDEHMICLTIIDKLENLQDEYNYLQNIKEIEVHLQHNQYSPGWYWLTIHDSKATKDQAIKKLLELENIENYKITVFGDNHNDIKMLKFADTGIAVENAIEEVKEIADKIIESNLNDGVIKHIIECETYITNNWN